MGMAACSQFISQYSLWFSFALTHFSYSNMCSFHEEESLRTDFFCMDFSPWATAPARKPYLVWTLHRLQGNNLHHCNLETAGEFLLMHLYLPCSLIWVSAGLFLSHFHGFCVSQWLAVFSTLFNHFFTEAPPDHLTGSAVPCSRSIGASWARLCLAKSRNWPLSLWPPLQNPAGGFCTSNKYRSILENIS